MAFLAPVAGAGLFGGTFGNIALAGLGIGIQLAAAYFFPQKVKGPRAESTKAQTSKYGDFIARVHGSGRVAGAVIWLKDDHVDEHKETEREGGKALGPVVTTYTYTADFAIAFAWNGPAAGIPRIWADNKLIYDNSAESLDEIINGSTVKGIGIAKGASIKIYLGTADQTPNADIEADRGVDNVPAWPGIVYIVIKNFPLDEFGIRLPNIEAEVVMAGEAGFVAYDIPNDSGVVDIFGNTLVTGGDTFFIYSLPGFVPLATHALGAGIVGGGPHVTARGDIAVARRASVFFGPTREVYIYDGQGGGLLETLVATVTGLNNFSTLCDIVVDGVDYLFQHDSPDLICYSNTGEGWAVAWEVHTMGMSTVTGSFSAGPEFLYFVATDSDNIFIINWTNSLTVDDVLTSPPGLTGSPLWISYDVETDSVFIGTTLGVFCYTPELDQLLSSNTDPTFFSSLTSGGNILGQPRIDGPVGSGTIIVRNNGVGAAVGDVIQLNKTDLTEVERWTTAESAPGWPNVGSSGYLVTSPEYSFFWGSGGAGSRAFFLPRVAKERIPLAEVIARECTYAGLPYDVSGITGDVVGYVVRDNAPPRGVLEDLARVRFFDFTQANGTTKFFMRQSTTMAASMIIPNDLGFSEGSNPDPKFVQEEYLDFRETPQRVVLSYNSADADYRTGAQAKTPPNPNKKVKGEWPEFPVDPPVEVAAPAGQNEGRMSFEFQTSLAMTDDEAAQTVDIFYNELLDATSVYHSVVGPKFLRTHPGDVIALDLDYDRRAMGTVITRMEGDLAIKLDFLRRTTIYTSDAIGVPTPNNPQSLLGVSRIAPIFLDGHLMRAEDDGNPFYVGVYGVERGSFGSGTIYKSSDLGTTYAPWLGFTSAVLRGIAQSVLPDRDHPDAWDYASTLTFFVASDEGVPNLPSSVTEAQLLADDELNGFAVRSADGEWEYIQAAEVTRDTNGLWTLSVLLRGRKGTDFAMVGHAVGDIVVYLDPNAMDRPPDGEKDLARIYAAIATSTTFTTQYATTFTNRAKGLRPWSPVGITATRDLSDNIHIDFFRRDRLGQHWPEDGPEDPPMSETTEAYKIYIYSLSAGILRTIDTTISEADYSAADQTTDFGSTVPAGELMIGVVQMSSVYGAGVERTAMI